MKSKRRKLPLVAALLFLVLAGCGMTPIQRLDYAGRAIGKTWDTGHPLFDAKCKVEAQKCANSGATSLPSCPGAADCLSALKAFKGALDAGDAAIVVGGPLVLAKKPGSDKWIKAALDALQRAVVIARKAGLFPGGSL